MAKEILTRCGYRCDLCLAYRENFEKDDKRQLLSDGWHKYFGFRIEPEDIVCDGCLKDDCIKNKLLDTGCPVRVCVKNKAFENCSQCDDFMCEKYKERLVDFNELEIKHGKISGTDRKLYINAYENGKRISELKTRNGQYCRMFNKELIPYIYTMSKFIGSECSKLWDELVDYIRANYNGIENITYGGQNYGWCFQYKQNKSKTLFTLFPERKAFTVLIVYGKKELEQVEECRCQLSSHAYEFVSNTAQLHDGKWIWYRVKSDADMEDLHVLMRCKRHPKKLM